MSSEFKRTNVGLGLRVKVVDLDGSLVFYLLRNSCKTLILLTHNSIFKIWTIFLKCIWGSTVIKWSLSLVRKNYRIWAFGQLWAILLLTERFTGNNMFPFVLSLIYRRWLEDRFSFPDCTFRLVFNHFYISFLSDDPLSFLLILFILNFCIGKRLWCSCCSNKVLFTLSWLSFTFSGILCNCWILGIL